MKLLTDGRKVIEPTEVLPPDPSFMRAARRRAIAAYSRGDFVDSTKDGYMQAIRELFEMANGRATRRQ